MDASALVKLFLGEPGRETLARAVEGARTRLASRLAYVECGAAFVRADREGRAPRGQLSSMVAALDEAWQDVTVVELDDEIARQAVAIARDHPLRASDAIHLASAIAMTPPSGRLTFACFDRRLWDAAGALGLDRFPTTPP